MRRKIELQHLLLVPPPAPSAPALVAPLPFIHASSSILHPPQAGDEEGDVFNGLIKELRQEGGGGGRWRRGSEGCFRAISFLRTCVVASS